MSEPPAAGLKRIDSRYLARVRWFGVKNVVAAAFRFPPVNAVAGWLGRRLLPARLHQRLPVRKGSAVYRMGNNRVVQLADAHRDLVARDLHWGGARPTSTAEFHKLRCLELLCEDARTFLDIGAYSGICALIAGRSNPGLRAIAYEIVPENYYLLVRNIVENDLVGQIEARLCALGAAEGELLVPEHLHLPSLETSFSLGSKFEAGIRIPVRTLDSEIVGLQSPFVVKIDVEGFEPQILEGGARFIEQHCPDIICEVLPDTGTSVRLERLLRPLGYRFFEFTEEGMPERLSITPGTSMRDWLFTIRKGRGVSN